MFVAQAKRFAIAKGMYDSANPKTFFSDLAEDTPHPVKNLLRRAEAQRGILTLPDASPLLGITQ